MNRLTRRRVLTGLFSSVAGAAMADAPLISLRPQARPGAAADTPIPRIPPQARALLQDLIAEANLGGTVGVVLRDAATGAVMVNIDGDQPLPPASVTKAVTALYALDALGAGYRFATRLLATGPVEAGVVQGDLVLAGGGDPTLSADDLAALAADLAGAGITGITGRLICWRGALPYAEEIEPSQLDHLGYNPAVSGLNLNFNRVHGQWRRVGGQWQTTMDARTEDRVPPVTMARLRIAERATPVWDTDGPDRWSVARGALGNGGSRWLPVRQPALYAGEVFRWVAAQEGVTLPAPVVVDDLPDGTELARHNSPTLRGILQDMLRYSTNLTAEICGLAASQARMGLALDIRQSAAEMTRWLGETYGIECTFVDHSGLSDETRISAAAMVDILVQDGADGPLRPILKDIVMRDVERNRLEDYPSDVAAKTGTLNFVSTLSGFVETADGSDLAFAIFAANLDRRARGKAAGDEIPEGSIAWNARAKRLQQVMLQRWGLIYQSRAMN